MVLCWSKAGWPAYSEKNSLVVMSGCWRRRVSIAQGDMAAGDNTPGTGLIFAQKLCGSGVEWQTVGKRGMRYTC